MELKQRTPGEQRAYADGIEQACRCIEVVMLNCEHLNFLRGRLHDAIEAFRTNAAELKATAGNQPTPEDVEQGVALFLANVADMLKEKNRTIERLKQQLQSFEAVRDLDKQ
jgi:hypothetical protein